MREVDEAVRKDEATDFAKKFGLPIGIALIVGLLAFGGYLVWERQTESRLEAQSEELILAIDELEAGNSNQADAELIALSEGTDGHAAMAAMLRAGIAIENGNTELAVELFERVANNDELPAELRDLATIRSVNTQYDTIDPQVVIDRLGPLAQPGNPYFGSAGELVAHAYYRQGNIDQAGPLLVSMVQDEELPESLRGRLRQFAGSLGYDTVDDVDAAIADITGEALPEEDAPVVELVE